MPVYLSIGIRNTWRQLSGAEVGYFGKTASPWEGSSYLRTVRDVPRAQCMPLSSSLIRFSSALPESEDTPETWETSNWIQQTGLFSYNSAGKSKESLVFRNTYWLLINIIEFVFYLVSRCSFHSVYESIKFMRAIEMSMLSSGFISAFEECNHFNPVTVLNFSAMSFFLPLMTAYPFRCVWPVLAHTMTNIDIKGIYVPYHLSLIPVSFVSPLFAASPFRCVWSMIARTMTNVDVKRIYVDIIFHKSPELRQIVKGKVISNLENANTSTIVHRTVTGFASFSRFHTFINAKTRILFPRFNITANDLYSIRRGLLNNSVKSARSFVFSIWYHIYRTWKRSLENRRNDGRLIINTDFQTSDPFDIELVQFNLAVSKMMQGSGTIAAVEVMPSDAIGWMTAGFTKRGRKGCWVQKT